jgi:tetratricopeptide (TPR) repeat protein
MPASPMPSDMTAAALADTILKVRTEQEWAASVERYGPSLLASPALIHQFAACVLQARAEGRVADAERLDRWRLAVQQARPDNRLKQQLAAAGTDEDLDRLIAEHAAAIDGSLVTSALDEVQHLLSPQAGMPPALAMATVGHILWVALRLAEHLRDPQLIIGCLNRRSQLAQQRGDRQSALADIRRASDIAAAAGLHFEAGRSLSIAGSLLVELGRLDEGLTTLLSSIVPLRQAAAAPNAGSGADMLLGSTYAEIAELYRERGDQQQWLSNLQLAIAHRGGSGLG